MINACETCTFMSHIFCWVIMVCAVVMFIATIVLCIKSLFFEV